MPERPVELRLRSADMDSILRRAKLDQPIESCGLMIGKRERGTCVCDHILPTKNAAASPVAFTISPEELLQGYRHADDVGMEVMGIYHSHPARARPSQTDQGFMKWSAPVWLIVSTLDWGFAAYRLDDGEPAKLRVTLV